MQAVRRRWQPLVLAALATVLVIGLVGAMSARGNGDDQEIRFPMVRSTAAVNAGCLANASAKVKVENEGAVEELTLNPRAPGNRDRGPRRAVRAPRHGRSGRCSRASWTSPRTSATRCSSR